MLYFIVNPAAGRKGAQRLFEGIVPLLGARRVEYEVALSQKPGGVEEIAREAVKRGSSGVVVVGGDGSVAEAARALANTKVPLGIIPAGTGNDLAQTLGVPKDAEAALYAILKGKTRDMDVGCINGRVFTNVAGTGLDVLVAKNVEKIKHVLTGLAGYGAAVLASLIEVKPERVTFETPEGVFKREVLLIAIANGRYYGGGMLVAPHADAFDGRFDVCVVNMLPRWKIPFLLSRFIKGDHLSLPCCEYFKTPWIKLDCERAAQFNLDGEIAERTPAEIRVLEGGVRVFVGE